MDSSNSGSFQSSSGGAGGGDNNEEYDSRTPSISSFLNPSNHFNPNLNHLLQPLSSSSHHHHNHRPPPSDTSFFDPSSTSSFSTPNTLQDLGSVWTGNIRSDRNLADFGTYPINPNPASTMDTNTKTSHGSDHLHQVTVKNPKKRTRASRRAPTTVLTTDTTNFRQMVQEFTGIPTAPFSSAPFSRRLDLFGRGSDGGGGSLYPLRPSAQKVQQQQPSFLNSTANIVESGTSNNITAATTSSNYQLAPADIHGFQKQPSTLLDIQNPMLSFQSLLQTTIPQQQSHHLSGFHDPSKRWRSEDEKLENFEGLIGNTQNIGGSKNVVVTSRNGDDQVQGNEESWICPSN
ncbi:uncharacterized protein LOC111921323 [Lactuca sativa]|uniref:VQ domain-containing protein n=1 Tax=Lactuca sativa TaxID=4236 RepID=A0A9R1UGX0_LACSA|nr:uncharacterized protein LOC111921323 [Lactuca sativa]KAJ0187205.1 hypothetical protein LSAT_V11C900472120 [Lactuca sativa]